MGVLSAAFAALTAIFAKVGVAVKGQASLYGNEQSDADHDQRDAGEFA